jgi:protein HOOK3
MADDGGVQVNTFDIPGRVTAWNQLEDGQVLWQILADIDADYFNDSLPNFDESTDRRRSITDSWIPKWQNLKHIERAVSQYIREECEQLPVLSKRMIPDLKTGARDGSMMLTAKLTMAVLVAACTSPKSGQRMLGHMEKLGTSAAAIANGIQELQALDRRMAELGVDQELTAEPRLSGYSTPTRAVSGAHSTVGRDTELEQEALLFESNKDRNALRSQVTKLKEEVDMSKSRISQLEEELVEAKLHLDDRGANGTSSDEVERLRNELTRERQYIDRLEGDHANAKDIIESLKKRNARFEAEHEGRQEMRDQLQLVRAERDELENKAKANENLKKKIESLSKESKNLENVRQELQEARERLQELEDVEDKCTALEKVNKENSATLVNCEQSIFEEKSKRARVEHDNLLLMKELEQTKELQYKAEELKRELEDRMRELEAHARGGSLEDELALDTSIDNIEPPSAKSVPEGRVSADSIALAQQVDILKARLKSMETETLKMMQENLGLRSDMMTNKDEDSHKCVLYTYVITGVDTLQTFS